MKTKIIKIDSSTVISKAITQAVRVIQNGGVIAFPTETVYGLAADAGNEDAIQRIFDLKRRPANKPILILISDKTQITEFVAKVSSIADRLMKKYWPGPLTIVFPAKSSVSSILRGGGDTIGIRIPSHPVAQALLQACICPLTAPSANISSTQPSTISSVPSGTASSKRILEIRVLIL